MPQYLITVMIVPRGGIKSPEAEIIQKNLPAVGYDNVTEFVVGKLMHFTIPAISTQAARKQATEMCNKFLVNGVIEDYTITASEIHEE